MPQGKKVTPDFHAQGLLEFLAYEPFYDNRNWGSLVLRKGEAGLERLLPLCSLLKGVMLRRTKDDVGPPHRHAFCNHVCCSVMPKSALKVRAQWHV